VAVLFAGCGKELPTASGAEGEERVVLAELFTAVWCGNCPYAESAIEELYQEEATNGPGGTPRLAVIEWHPSFGQGDPYAIPAADDRIEDYDYIFGSPIGLPMAIFSGVTGISSGTPQTYDEYRAQFEQYAQVPASVRLSLEIVDDVDHLHFSIRVKPIVSLAEPQIEVTAVLVEDGVVNTSGMGPETLGFVARSAQSAPVALADTQMVTAPLLTLPVDRAWVRDNLYVVAFAQETGQSTDHEYREVLQATILRLVTGADFAFVATTPETEVGISVGGVRQVPFEIRNTGTLADTFTLDLPAAFTQVPAGWAVGLIDAAGDPLAVPLERALPSGSTLSELRIAVAAPSPGSGAVALTIASHGDPALADTLWLALTAGVFDLDLSAEETAIQLTADQPRVAPFALENAGTLTDSVRIELPAALNHLPSGWTAALVGSDGSALGAMPTLRLAPGARADLGLQLLAGDVGQGTLGLVATSRGDPARADTLTFTIEARAYNLQFHVEDPQIWVVVGERALAPFEIRNTGSRDDLVRLTLPPELQALPAGWSVGLAYADGMELETPYWLPLEAGSVADAFRILIRAETAGQGIARLVALSSGDPSLADTLALAIVADAYGFRLAAPGGTEIELELYTPASIPIEIANTGTLADTLRVDRPAALQSIPEGWEVSLDDAGGAPLALPLDLPLPPGTVQDAWHIRALTPFAGEATVALVVASRARPALCDTLRLHLAAGSNDFAFDLTAEETTLHVPAGSYPGFFTLPFHVVSRGIADDTIRLQMSWVTQPQGWTSIPIICEEYGTCFGPLYDAMISAGGAVDNLVVDLYVPAVGGTAVVRLTAASLGDPTQVHALDFTFTTEAAARSATARPADATPSTLAGARHADAAPRHRQVR
jgi:hypothetical protein